MSTDSDTTSYDMNGGYSWTSQQQRLSTPDIPVRGGRKPTFVEVPPREIEVYEGDPLTLRCTVDGDPRPVGKFRWSRRYYYFISTPSSHV